MSIEKKQKVGEKVTSEFSLDIWKYITSWLSANEILTLLCRTGKTFSNWNNILPKTLYVNHVTPEGDWTKDYNEKIFTFMKKFLNYIVTDKTRHVHLNFSCELKDREPFFSDILAIMKKPKCQKSIRISDRANSVIYSNPMVKMFNKRTKNSFQLAKICGGKGLPFGDWVRKTALLYKNMMLTDHMDIWFENKIHVDRFLKDAREKFNFFELDGKIPVYSFINQPEKDNETIHFDQHMMCKVDKNSIFNEKTGLVVNLIISHKFPYSGFDINELVRDNHWIVSHQRYRTVGIVEKIKNNEATLLHYDAARDTQIKNLQAQGFKISADLESFKEELEEDFPFGAIEQDISAIPDLVYFDDIQTHRKYLEQIRQEIERQYQEVIVLGRRK